MATRNDFKILDQKCFRIFQLASSTILKFDEDVTDKLDEQTKKRFGFYYLILQYVLGINDYDELTSLICDQEFNSKLLKDNSPDEGIDAVYVNEDERIISVFNFKFREKFNLDKEQSINEILHSEKFFNAIDKGRKSFEGKIGEAAERIIECNDSSDVWKTFFYVVSNENISIDRESAAIKDLEDVHGITVCPIGLNEIVDFMSMHPKAINADLLLPSKSVISYSEDSLSSDIYYILCICLTDLIRITSDNSTLREDTNLEDDSRLSSVDVEKDVLYENVRGYILRSKFNGNILRSLDSEPEKFFFYNNGLTIVAKDINSQKVNSNKKVRLQIRDFQVLNGGQTLRTIHKFNRINRENINKLSQASVLVRVMKVAEDDLKSKISEYTNSQNAISQIDLKSMRTEQVQLQSFLSSHNILYIRKNGDTGEDNKDYKCTVTIQQMGQILYAVKGYPGQVSNKKKDIFTKEYDALFCTDDLLSNQTIEYIQAFFKIKKEYKTRGRIMDLKLFFILYLSVKLGRTDYKELIDEFEKYLETKKDSEMKTSRLLITPTFMSGLKAEFNIK